MGRPTRAAKTVATKAIASTGVKKRAPPSAAKKKPRKLPKTPVTPKDVRALEAAFGKASTAAFGSAMFWYPGATSVKTKAMGAYEQFCGKSWARLFKPALGDVFKIKASGAGDTVLERAVAANEDVEMSCEMLGECDGTGKGMAALETVFGAKFSVSSIGDGEAYSGVLLAGKVGGGVAVLTFLSD